MRSKILAIILLIAAALTSDASVKPGWLERYYSINDLNTSLKRTAQEEMELHTQLIDVIAPYKTVEETREWVSPRTGRLLMMRDMQGAVLPGGEANGALPLPKTPELSAQLAGEFFHAMRRTERNQPYSLRAQKNLKFPNAELSIFLSNYQGENNQGMSANYYADLRNAGIKTKTELAWIQRSPGGWWEPKWKPEPLTIKAHHQIAWRGGQEVFLTQNFTLIKDQLCFSPVNIYREVWRNKLGTISGDLTPNFNLHHGAVARLMRFSIALASRLK